MLCTEIKMAEMALMIGASVIGAIGQMQQANAQADSFKFQSKIDLQNASINELNSQRELDAASVEEGMSRDRLRRTLGAARTATAKSGIAMTGSALFVQDDSIIQGELDALMIRNKGDLASSNYKSQAAINKAQSSMNKTRAKNAKTAGLISAGTTLLSGGAAAAGMGSPGAGLSTNGGGMAIPIDFRGYRSPFG